MIIWNIDVVIEIDGGIPRAGRLCGSRDRIGCEINLDRNNDRFGAFDSFIADLDNYRQVLLGIDSGNNCSVVGLDKETVLEGVKVVNVGADNGLLLCSVSLRK